MPTERRPSVAAVTAALSLMAACGGHRAAAQAGATAPVAATAGDLLPLIDGTVLAYETETESSGERGVIILQVSRPRPGLVELDDGGKVRRVEIEPHGVRLGTGGYWLKEPLRLGACWPGAAGETCITAMGVDISVPAGRFADCVRTVEQSSGSSRVTTVFCPRVGMVSLEVEGEIEGEPERERALLRSFGPRVNVVAE